MGEAIARAFRDRETDGFIDPNGKNSRAPATATGAPVPVQEEEGEFLTTAQGLRLPDTDHSLKAGPRGPTLLEDFHLREKITHFDHERIPERVVHARGAAAHGTFESYGTAQSVTKAGSWPARACRPMFSSGSPPCLARAARRTRSAIPAGSR